MNNLTENETNDLIENGPINDLLTAIDNCDITPDTLTREQINKIVYTFEQFLIEHDFEYYYGID